MLSSTASKIGWKASDFALPAVDGKTYSLADVRGPFGNPTSDSARTMVTTSTTRAFLVVFAPREVDEQRLATVLDSTSRRMTEFTGCRESGRQI